MRQYKFRAWYKAKEGSPDYLSRMMYEDYPGRAFQWLRESKPRRKSIEIMQWTGLTDKNGKEIYEGDILVYNLYHGQRRYEELKGDVFFEKSCFFMRSNHWAGNQWDGGLENFILSKVAIAENDPYKDIFLKYAAEIIGNIYENPDILEKQKCA